jgi:methionine-rich copper-binding protein CopC
MDPNPAAASQSSKKLLYGAIGIILLLLLGVGAYFLLNQEETTPSVNITQKVSSPSSQATESASPTPAQSETKTPHFVSSSPSHGAVLDQPVSEVSILFNFDLGAGSKTEVLGNGNSVVAQPATISTDKLSMKTLINPVTPGNYVVNYTACWPDGSCHEGTFSFSVK